ncbi:MAG: hypothetical protein OH319_02260 [Candidatus Parvarchaeota archaeon]|nr:hypothetical protein [Candidatus Jingweiarchaeum tengchongense]MCW1298191.1 hypothetical protein [Candidatus Jingweiarchaeum tengchongense]MCW1299989.1 hypothetical protein [Candidatus Jingweiarchaeum tengchongense]MCW1305021.1 hypothetical protein [Candidatus Jingweiarchaeum tengchongense]MCW1305462.1 hypothetical protein [Candidatus Jingweiarchaeum tengchongense]
MLKKKMKILREYLRPDSKKIILASILTVLIPCLYNYIINFSQLQNFPYFPIRPINAIIIWLFFYFIAHKEKLRWSKIVQIFIFTIIAIFWMAIFKNANSFHMENFVLFFLLAAPFVFSTIITYLVLKERKKIGFQRIGIAAGGVLSLFFSSLLWIVSILFYNFFIDKAWLIISLPLVFFLIALFFGSVYGWLYKKYLYKRREIKSISRAMLNILLWLVLLLIPWIFDYLIKVYHLEKKLSREVG